MDIRDDIALRDRATEAGYHDGWTHAAYSDAYGGDPQTEPDVPQRFAPVASYYAAAWTDGATAYHDDTDDPPDATPARDTDPDRALFEARDHGGYCLNNDPGDANRDEWITNAREALQRYAALDDWLARGGALPTPWLHSPTNAAS